MNRKDFGQLVKALRKEHLDEHNHYWTQRKLAEKTGLSEAIIGYIERGQYAKLTSGILLRLADALQLTSGERKEFFAAASGVGNDQIALGSSDPQQILEHCLHMLEQIQLPAYLVDSYLDVIATNRATLCLYNLPENQVRQWVDWPHPINVMDVLFSPMSNLHNKHGTESQFQFAHRNILFLRLRSLQYRATLYFAQLLARLRQYPEFDRYWQQARFDNGDHGMGHDIRLNSEQWGPLAFMTATATIVTQHSDLEILVYAPIDVRTRQIFAEIIGQSGMEVILTSRWPKKPV